MSPNSARKDKYTLEKTRNQTPGALQINEWGQCKPHNTTNTQSNELVVNEYVLQSDYAKTSKQACKLSASLELLLPACNKQAATTTQKLQQQTTKTGTCVVKCAIWEILQDKRKLGWKMKKGFKEEEENTGKSNHAVLVVLGKEHKSLFFQSEKFGGFQFPFQKSFWLSDLQKCVFFLLGLNPENTSRCTKPCCLIHTNISQICTSIA